MTDICRLCLVNILNPSDVVVYKDDVPTEEKIKLILPEIDIGISTTLLLCDLCSHLLSATYTFKCGSLKTEDLIKKYVAERDDVGPINLADVKEFRDEINNKANEDCFVIKGEVLEEDISETKVLVISKQLPNVSINHENSLETDGNECNEENPWEGNGNNDENSLEETGNDNKTFEADGNLCKVYKCSECHAELATQEDMDKHFREHKLMKPFACEDCGKLFKEPYELRVHILSNHSDTPPLACNICHKIYPSEKSLLKHKVTHEITQKTHMCHLCNKAFYQLKHLKSHMERHKTESHLCKICGLIFNARSYLKRHIITKHRKPSVCETCGLRCSSKSTLVEHIRTHTGERPFRCEKCGKGFAQRSTLTVHIRSQHETAKPFMCEACGRSFALKGSLTKHKVIHMERTEKTVACKAENCDKKFWSQKDMLKHMLRHTGNKTEQCSVCEKMFFDKNAVRRHMRSHTGERPYECHTCHKTFSQRYNLQVHFKSHRPKVKKGRGAAKQDKSV